MNVPLLNNENLEKAISNLKNELVLTNKFFKEELNKIYLAIEIGKLWHHNQFRDTGDLYFIHPVRVATKCLHYYPNKTLIIAALLHDTLEDCTNASYKEILHRFGKSIAHLVQALTKLKKESRILSVERILKLAQIDSRVLLIKILDRLDNLSDLDQLSRKRQRLNATESIVYATVAEGIGLPHLSSEIRNSAFRILYPRRYKKILGEIENVNKANKIFYNEIEEELWKIIGKKKCIKIFYELKTPFDFTTPNSKVINTLKNFYIFMELPINCYTAIGLLHNKLPVIPKRFRDYIANPLANGWQGLTTTVICKGLTIELWISTYDYFLKNQFGIYGLNDTRLPQSKSYREFIEKFTNLFSETNIDIDDIFRNQYKSAFNFNSNEQLQVCSPKGEIIQLYIGATTLDYAYEIHSEIGATCVGAIINETYRVEPNYQLQEGDMVEIITDKSTIPQKRWLNWVVMPHSRKEILAYIRRKERNTIQK